MFRYVLPFYDVIILNLFNVSLALSGFRNYFDLPGKGGSESRTRRPEFLSSEVGNPSCPV
jgi:hypothetical protein